MYCHSLIIKHFKCKKFCTNSLSIKMRKGRINSAMCCVTWLCNWVSTLYTLNSDTKVSICFVHFRLHLNNNETRRCLKNHFSGISNNLVIRNTCFEKIFILQQNLSWPRFFLIFQLLRSDVLRLSVLWVLAVPKSYPCHIKYTLCVLRYVLLCYS